MDLSRTNSPTSARREDGLENIRIWVTPPKKLVFWDDAPSSYTNFGGYKPPPQAMNPKSRHCANINQAWPT